MQAEMIYRESTGIDNFKIGTRTSVMLRNGLRFPSGLKTQVAFGTSKKNGSFTKTVCPKVARTAKNKYSKKVSLRDEVRVRERNKQRGLTSITHPKRMHSETSAGKHKGRRLTLKNTNTKEAFEKDENSKLKTSFGSRSKNRPFLIR